MNNLQHFIFDKLVSSGVNETVAIYLNMLALVIALLLFIYVLDTVIRRILRRLSVTIARRTKSNFDDLLIHNKVPRNIAHIIPLLVFVQFVPYVFIDFPKLEQFIEVSLMVFAILLSLWIVRSFLNTVKDYLKTLQKFKDKPIDSYIQVFMIFAWIFGVFGAFAIITGISFLNFAAGLGTASAIIILIFKDTILGFVASIQVSINDMVRIGDWITFEKYGADGDVIEINLATVKVQNFDKTITTIPTYALISDSFKNWRGMMASGGRRIKRSVIIKVSTIRFLTERDIEKLQQIELITDYIKDRAESIKSYNEERNVNKEQLINGRNLTNFGVFRKYLQTYIENHSGIKKDMTFMVRQLAPTSQGIPMEIYAFTADIRWQNYEYIMGDIFDHVLAAVKYFDLEIYELSLSS
ncbi:MAG: mechanosensitive ion channel [Winogradskyella sp.]|nr:mechanosensitive ion channel [Winogradskyella sp.]